MVFPEVIDFSDHLRLQLLLNNDLADGTSCGEVLEAGVHALTKIGPDCKVSRTVVLRVSTSDGMILEIHGGSLEPPQVITKDLDAEVAVGTQDPAYLTSKI
jgi:hypothetical protein